MKSLTSICTENAVGVAILIFAVTFPVFHDGYTVDQFTNFYIACILSFSIMSIWGYTGIFSFGQAAFFGIGAYVYAIVSLCTDKNLTLPAVLAGILVPFVMALIIGYFIFYGGVSEIFTGIITLCISLVCQSFMVQTSGPEWKLLGVWLGGFNGLNNIPKIQLGGFTFSGNSMYFLAVATVFVLYFIFRQLSRSNLGYAMFSVRESKARSELFGFRVARIQTMTFAVSGALAGLGGVLFASWSGYVVPSTLSVDASTVAVVMVAVAGKKNITGIMLMTIIYSWFTQYLASQGNQYSNIILGVILVLAVMFMPEGIMQEIFNRVDRLGLSIRNKIKTFAVSNK